MVYHTFENIKFVKYERDVRSDYVAMFIINKEQYLTLEKDISEDMKKNFWIYDNLVEDQEGNELTERSYFLKFRKPSFQHTLEKLNTGDLCKITLEHKHYSFTPKDKTEQIQGFTTKLCAVEKQ